MHELIYDIPVAGVFRFLELSSSIGTVPELGSRESHIPIILVQNPGFRSSMSDVSRPSFGCGFDIIIPAGWSTAFWISLIYRRAQPAGLREHGSVMFESGKLISPESYPDSTSGEEMNVTAYRERYGKYCRMPPAKRCNYVKLGVVAPFHFPWKDLVAQWQARTGVQTCNSFESFYVLRHRHYLRHLIDRSREHSSGSDRVQQDQSIIKRGALQNRGSRRIIMLRRPGVLHATKSASDKEFHLKNTSNVKPVPCSKEDAFRNEPCLVPVVISLRNKGAPSRHSMICIPTAEDLSASSVALNPAGPVELRHRVHRNNEQKEQTQVKSDLKDCKKSLVTKEVTVTDAPQQETKNKVAKKKSIEFETLPLPVCENVVESSSRLVIGYVVEGGFSHAAGCVKGLGFVSLQGLLTLLDAQAGEKELEVLVRTPSSYQYRRALLTINVDFSP